MTEIKKLEFDGYMLSSKNPNNCCILSSGIIATINNIDFKNNILYFTVKQYFSVKPLFTSPRNSILLGIYEISCNKTDVSNAIVTTDQILRKCLKADKIMSFEDNSSVVISLLH